MRTRLIPVLAAISTPPHLPFQFFDGYKTRFKNLEVKMAPYINRSKEVSNQVDEINGFWFYSPLHHLPFHMRDLIYGLSDQQGYHEEALSKKIQEFQDYSKFKNAHFDTIRSIIARMIRVEFKRADYFSFFKDYYKFIKEYPDTLEDLSTYIEQAKGDPQSAQRFADVVTLLKNYRNSLDTLYQYINLYLEFAGKVEALLLRRDMQVDAYFNGRSERKQRPPHKDIEVLYHVTVNLGSILSSGFKSRDDLGGDNQAVLGLGGGVSDALSFTADIEIARAIADSLREVVHIAHGDLSYEDILVMAQQDGVDPEVFENTKRDYGRGDSKRLAYEAYRMFLHYTNVRYNPVFFGVRIENFERVDINQVGIIAARIQMNQVTEYLREMEEFRVPVSAILSIKKVKY